MAEISKERYTSSRADAQTKEAHGLDTITIEGKNRDVIDIIKDTAIDIKTLQNDIEGVATSEINDVKEYYKKGKDRNDMLQVRKKPHGEHQIECCVTAGSLAHAMQYIIAKTGATPENKGFINNLRSPKVKAGIKTLKKYLNATYQSNLTLNSIPDKAFIDALTAQEQSNGTSVGLTVLQKMLADSTIVTSMKQYMVLPPKNIPKAHHPKHKPTSKRNTTPQKDPRRDDTSPHKEPKPNKGPTKKPSKGKNHKREGKEDGEY